MPYLQTTLFELENTDKHRADELELIEDSRWPGRVFLRLNNLDFEDPELSSSSGFPLDGVEALELAEALIKKFRS